MPPTILSLQRRDTSENVQAGAEGVALPVLVGQQQEQDGMEVVVEGDSVPPLLLALIVAFELARVIKRPH